MTSLSLLAGRTVGFFRIYISYPDFNNDLWVQTSVNDQEMPQSQTERWHQETRTLEHRQIKDTHRSQNAISKVFSSLYLSESIAKLEMTQYKRLTRSAKHEPPENTTKIVSNKNHKLQTIPWHVRRSCTTIAKHQEDKVSKATSSLFPIALLS